MTNIPETREGKMSVWDARAQKFLQSTTRAKDRSLLYELKDRHRIIAKRIEALERRLKEAGWKARYSHPAGKSPYADETVKQLAALPPRERANSILARAAEEGIDRRSVYRKLQKCAAWSLRARR